MSFTHIYLFVCFVTIAPLTSESARLPGDCFRSYDQKVSAQQQRDVLPQCTIFMSNGSPVPRISCPEPGIVRFEGEYDAVHINCSASYPLDFKFNGTKPTEAIHVRFRRTVKEKSHGEIVSYHADVTIFSIRALHRFYSKSNPDWKQSISKQYQYSRTGGYTFLGFRENAFLKTDFYFFFEEELATRQFITNREGWKLRWDQYGKIIIPCRPTHFNSLVTLKQETNIPVLFTYSLTQGFISSHKATGVQGTFFCIMQDRGNGTTLKYDTAGLQVPYGYHVKPKDYNVDIQYNVTALPWGHYETKARCRPSCGTFDCGSNETAVLASIGVFNPSMDNLLNDFVLPKFQLRSYTVKIEHVQKDINHEIRFENGTLDYVAGIYCGNRDRSKKATFGRTLTGIVYPFKYGHDWSAVDRDHAEIRFYLNIWHNRPGQDLYENEDIVFECRLQTFVLAPPSIWFFEWENGTITEELVDYNWIDGVSRLSTKLFFGIKRVYCVGSIWHKTFWRNTSIPINVLPSTMPYFKHEGNPVKRFVSSSTLQYLKCTAYGGPKPTISWQHYGTNITSVTYTMDYSLLHFNEVNATIQGLYDCIACNVVGCKKKVYAVEVFSVDTPDAQCLTEETEVHGVSLLTYLATLLILIVIMIVIAITTRWRGQLANGLGKQELDAFFHGEKGCTWAIGGDLARCQPYNQAYEIPKKRFKIYRRDRLGTGEYGVVLRGSIDGKVTAVKMIKHSEDKQHLKFLMNELKIMIHLGRHENLVELVGAYTKELERSKLYVFLKFYKLGSLESYLRDNRCSFHVTKPAYVKFSNISSAENIFTIKDLFKWSKEIALGMEYLSRKKIVHADLAVRNVLLDDTRTARVTDYGLSRRIYDYNVNCIIKSDDDRGLPLRWMAMESFLDGSFSFKSDVWSYGVTLWEIFSLGNTPYGTETVSSTFVTKLERGHRLPKPNYASDRLYYEVMRKCWLSVPCQRPNFSEIVETIQNLPTDAETTERNRKDSSGSDHKHYSHYSDASEFEECD